MIPRKRAKLQQQALSKACSLQCSILMRSITSALRALLTIKAVLDNCVATLCSAWWAPAQSTTSATSPHVAPAPGSTAGICLGCGSRSCGSCSRQV
jgi:hypothetical protein